ncbi:lipocalin family protein [Flavobacterium piscis]|uniref:Lipocalin n=1 Tax=Flavobacterium piscis TaxID=1114874 RepID=A0ABU1Y791_9FLAO|nr:lipocalin family protein [Flavobacterium piscis]MDR7209958.1 lipocalin [Flavobacterium piscis]
MGTSIRKAKFVRKDNVGMLKVSFFGPFYSGYNVIAIDEDYKYALVAGESLKYKWMLLREVVIPEK